MRITNISARGILSFEDFTLELDRRVTVVVGPNGAGKSNLGRLLELVQGAVDQADRASPELQRALAAFYASRRTPIPEGGISVRIGFELNDEFERNLVVAFIRAAAVSALVGNHSDADIAGIDAWAERQITSAKLRPLFRGTLAVTHQGTDDADWEVGVDFNVRLRGRKRREYRWILAGRIPDAVVAVDAVGARDLGTGGFDAQLTRLPLPGGHAPSAPRRPFTLSRLLPAGRQGVTCRIDLGHVPPSESVRRFSELIGISPLGTPRRSTYDFAGVMATVLHRSVERTSDSRLLPTSTGDQSRLDIQEDLAEKLLFLKNAPATERAHYQGLMRRFWDFTSGRQVDVTLERVSAAESGATDTGDAGDGLRVIPRLLVSTDRVAADERGPIPQVPIEFAGAGAWEALVLASVLGSEGPPWAVVLDEPAVALHPTLQRIVRAHLLASRAQLIVITHSPYLLPLDQEDDQVRIVRFDRDGGSNTRVWTVDPAIVSGMSRKLIAKGNERLFFAGSVILCEGETDVAAVRSLAARLELDLDAANVFIVDCGSRDNLPDYIALASAAGIPFLALMDGDASKAAREPSVEAHVEAVRVAVHSAPRGALVEFPEDIETTLQVRKQRRSLVPRAIARLDLGRAPSPVAALIEHVTQLAGSTSVRSEEGASPASAQTHTKRG